MTDINLVKFDDLDVADEFLDNQEILVIENGVEAKRIIFGTNLTTLGKLIANGILRKTATGIESIEQITNDLLANNSVTNNKILNETITGNKLENQTITNDKIQNSTITFEKIATNAILGSNIANATITLDKMAEDFFTSSEFQNFLTKNNNLSDLTNPSLARTNLGIGSASLLNSTDVLQKNNNLSDVNNTILALNNLNGVSKTRNINTGFGLIGGGNLESDLNISINSSEVVRTTQQVIAGSGLSGGGVLSGNVTLSLPNVVSSGNYGSSTQVPRLTVDSKGRITGVSLQTISTTPQVYTGSNKNNTNFPIGTYIQYRATLKNYEHSESVPVRLGTVAGQYNDINGSFLTGTWRHRGQAHANVGNGAQRVF